MTAVLKELVEVHSYARHLLLLYSQVSRSFDQHYTGCYFSLRHILLPDDILWNSRSNCKDTKVTKAPPNQTKNNVIPRSQKNEKAALHAGYALLNSLKGRSESSKRSTTAHGLNFSCITATDFALDAFCYSCVYFLKCRMN